MIWPITVSKIKFFKNLQPERAYRSIYCIMGTTCITDLIVIYKKKEEKRKTSNFFIDANILSPDQILSSTEFDVAQSVCNVTFMGC